MFTSSAYYSLANSQWERHFDARLIMLNKKFPSIPDYTEYRPIVVSSPVVKYLEGIIMPYLRVYAVNRMNRSQYGFCP